LHILSVLIPNLHIVAILPYADGFDESCFQSLFFDGLGIPAALQDQESHALDEEERHLVSHMLLEAAVLL